MKQKSDEFCHYLARSWKFMHQPFVTDPATKNNGWRLFLENAGDAFVYLRDSTSWVKFL